MRGKQGVPEKKHTLAAIVPLTIPQGTGESRRMEYLPALLAYISKISTLTYKKTGLREASQQGQFFIPPPHGRGIFFAKIKCKMGCKKAAVVRKFALANFRTAAYFGFYFSPCFNSFPNQNSISTIVIGFCNGKHYKNLLQTPTQNRNKILIYPPGGYRGYTKCSNLINLNPRMTVVSLFSYRLSTNSRIVGFITSPEFI